MVAGRLQEKNGFYYIVLSYTDSAGKRRQPWIGTGLPVKGNKKRAEKMLAETRKDFTIPKGQVSELDRKSTRLNSSHSGQSRMPSSA